MSQDNLMVKYNPSFGFGKDLFGDNPKIGIQRRGMFYHTPILLVVLLNIQLYRMMPRGLSVACIIVSILLLICACILNIVGCLKIQSHSSEWPYEDWYTIDENKNLSVTRYYSKDKQLNRTILYKDIKGLKICKYLWSKLVILDSSEGNIVLYQGSKDLKKILDFFNSYYPDIETKGNFKAIEASIKGLYLECIIFIMLIFLLASSWISCTIYFLR